LRREEEIKKERDKKEREDIWLFLLFRRTRKPDYERNRQMKGLCDIIEELPTIEKHL